MNKIIFYILLIFILISCCDDNLDCVGAACTEEFLTLAVTIVDLDYNPVDLESYKVVTAETKQDITINPNQTELDWMKSFGMYPLFSDSFANDYINDSVEINFMGYINNKIVVNEKYIVGADCCHVHLIEGQTDIQLDI